MDHSGGYERAEIKKYDYRIKQEERLIKDH